MTTHNGDLGLGWILLAREFLGEGLSTDDIQSGDTKETAGVEGTSSLEDLCGNRDGGVDRVRDDADKSLWAEFSDALDQIPHDAGVHFEEVITSHARLA